jgi:hypothetical protein
MNYFNSLKSLSVLLLMSSALVQSAGKLSLLYHDTIYVTTPTAQSPEEPTATAATPAPDTRSLRDLLLGFKMPIGKKVDSKTYVVSNLDQIFCSKIEDADGTVYEKTVLSDRIVQFKQLTPGQDDIFIGYMVPIKLWNTDDQVFESKILPLLAPDQPNGEVVLSEKYFKEIGECTLKIVDDTELDTIVRNITQQKYRFSGKTDTETLEILKQEQQQPHRAARHWMQHLPEVGDDVFVVNPKR